MLQPAAHTPACTVPLPVPGSPLMTSNAHRQVDSVAFKKLSFKFGGYKARYAWVSQRGYYPEDLDKANQDTHAEIEDFGADIDSILLIPRLFCLFVWYLPSFERIGE